MSEPKTLEDILMRTAKYLQFFAYNNEDKDFMHAFNTHFGWLASNGYKYEVDIITPNQYMIQITYGDHGVSRPEIISFPESGGKYL